MVSDILQRAAAKLNENQKWTIVCHENPDGDTLGCGLALYSLGVRLGKNARVIGRDPLPPRYAFLAGSDLYEAVSAFPADAIDSLVISVDTSTVQRSVPGFAEALAVCADSVSIDHHGDNAVSARLNIVNAGASATAEIVADLFEAGGWEFTKDEAVALYTALSTDNGNFRFASASPRSHICAAKLLEAGAEPDYVDDCVNENLSGPVLALWGLALSRTELLQGGRAALFWLSKEDLSAAGADASSVDGLVNMLLRIRGVKAAAFLCEIFGGNKVSVRTRQPYSARVFASKFGGGGHIQAAGARIPGTFGEALNTLRTELDRYAADGHSSDQ